MGTGEVVGGTGMTDGWLRRVVVGGLGWVEESNGNGRCMG